MPEIKECTHCGEMKGIEQFDRSSKSRDGRRHNCKACAREYYHKVAKPRNKRRATRAAKKKASVNGWVPVNVSRRAHALLQFCAFTEGTTEEEYLDGVLRTHLRDNVLEDLVKL